MPPQPHPGDLVPIDEDLVAELYAPRFEPWALPGTDSSWVQVSVDGVTGRRVVR